MKYAGLIKNDVVNGEGVCVSYWAQGCPFHCEGCHNPQTWNENGGTEVERDELVKEILQAISTNGIKRNFSVLGGEPLAIYNRENTTAIIKAVREKYPNIKIFLWTGYSFEAVDHIIKNMVDYIIDGQYFKEARDLTLHLRGSRNQHIWKKNDNGNFEIID